MRAITASSLSLLAGIEKSDGRPTRGVHFGHFANGGGLQLSSLLLTLPNNFSFA